MDEHLSTVSKSEFRNAADEQRRSKPREHAAGNTGDGEHRQIAEELGLDALVEAHDEREVEMALNAGARIVGVNNRDLRTFEVNMQNSIRLRNMAPRDVVFISESGIKGPEDIRVLYENDVDAVLIGETLMRSHDKGEALRQLNGGTLEQLRLAV